MSDVTTTHLRIKSSWFLGIFLAFLLFAGIAVYSARMTRDYSDDYEQRETVRYANLAKMREEATKTLTTVDWIDQDKKIVRIPIDEAMTKELDDLKNKPAQIGAALPTAAPAPPPAPAAPAPAAANAAPAAPAPPAAKPKQPTTNSAPAAPPAKPIK